MDKKKIGILYICTGQYAIFWKAFYESMEQYFITDSEKHYFVFTDQPEIAYEKEHPNIHRIFQKNLGWPDNTLLRFEVFLNHQKQFENMEYLFFFNANLLVKQTITADEFLPTHQEKLMACLHPGFYAKSPNKFPYETNSASTAYIPSGKGIHYFAGGLNGGFTANFLEAMQSMATAAAQDSAHGIVAAFHDESHWNKYLLDKPYIKILSASYLYPEGLHLSVPEIIMIRDKQKYGGHYKMRGEKLSLSTYTYLTIRRTVGRIKRTLFSLLHITE
ncbi:MAG: family 6 glucosyltransferase [Pseudomonadota bacterium]